MTATSTPRSRLLEILSFARPHDSPTERAFCREFLDTIPGMTSDAFGNRSLRLGTAPVLWSCHVDTVAARGGPQALSVDEFDVVSLANGKPGMSLGADDGVGVWMMLEMIAAKRPGLYLFHRGEEVGCLGSSWIVKHTPEVLEGIEAAMAFDRAGYSDVITHQSNGRTCSDAFARSFAAQLNDGTGLDYRPDDGGVYTDTNEYCFLIPECSNVSVGYRGQHGPRETQDLAHAMHLLCAMLRLDTTALVIERDPDVREVSRWDDWGGNASSRGFASSRHPTSLVEMIELCTEHPAIAAAMLTEHGFDVDDFMTELWVAEELEDDIAERGAYAQDMVA